jgi:hypothetical protein
MAYDVFVSHSSVDKAVANATVAVLERRGLRCWVAPRDIVAGADWGTSIINAIHTSRAMVIIFSTNSNASEHVKREVERAIARKIPVIPLRIENIMPSGAMEFFLSTPHWMDALTPPMEQHLERLAVALQNLLAGIPSPPQNIPPPKPKGPWKLLAVIGGLVLLALLLLIPLRTYLQDSLAKVDPKLVGYWRSKGMDLLQTGGIAHRLHIGADQTFELDSTYHADDKLAENLAREWGFDYRNQRVICKFDDQDHLVSSTMFLANRLGNMSFWMPTAKYPTYTGDLDQEQFKMRWTRQDGSPGVCAATWTLEKDWSGIKWALTLKLDTDSRFNIDGKTKLTGTFTAKNTSFHLEAKETGRGAEGSYEMRGDRLIMMGFFNTVPAEWFPTEEPSPGVPSISDAIKNFSKKLRGK